jgi:osmoprotectant transport system substrate-binding protein
MKRKIIALLIVMTMTLVMSACANSTNSTNEKNETKEVINPDDPIVVSTMNDTEGEVLGRMMVLALKDAGFEVKDNTFGYTGTANGRTALLEGETDIYMDYTGRGLSLIEGVDKELYHDVETAWKSVSTWDAKTNNLIWLRYAPFNNTDAVAVTRKFAEENNVYSWGDFANYVNNGGFVKLVTHDYWVTIPTGLSGMEKTYGFKLDKDQYTIVSANNEQMLAEGTDGVNAAMLYSSSGLVKAYDLVVLEDPEHVSPVYSPTPIIRKERLDKYPQVKEVLDKVFESITLEEMIEMNKQVQVDGASGMDVAKEHLLSKNLIKE